MLIGDELRALQERLLAEGRGAIRALDKDHAPWMGGSLYYDRFGEAITFGQWGVLHGAEDYKILRQERYPDGALMLSTVWLGTDHSWGDGPPLIFETALFSPTLEMADCWRASSEKEALENHNRALSLIAEVNEVTNQNSGQPE